MVSNYFQWILLLFICFIMVSNGFHSSAFPCYLLMLGWDTSKFDMIFNLFLMIFIGFLMVSINVQFVSNDFHWFSNGFH